EDCRPAGSFVCAEQAVRTPFQKRDGLQFLELAFRQRAGGSGPGGPRFVLANPESGAWLKSGGKNLYLPLFEGEGDARLSSAKLRDLAEQIVGAERGGSSWTLMHRFNLCHDL